jgi:hypothetical protein
MMMYENKVLERLVRDIKAQLNLDKSNLNKKQQEVNDYIVEIAETEQILTLLESKLHKA